MQKLVPVAALAAAMLGCHTSPARQAPFPPLPPPDVHAGNFVEVGGAPGTVTVEVGGTPGAAAVESAGATETVSAFPWNGHTVIAMPALGGWVGQARIVRNGVEVRTVALSPVTNGPTGAAALQYVAALESFVASPPPAPADAGAQVRYADALKRLQDLLPRLRAVVESASAGPVDLGGGVTVGPDDVAALDRLVLGTQQAVPLGAAAPSGVVIRSLTASSVAMGILAVGLVPLAVPSMMTGAMAFLSVTGTVLAIEVISEATVAAGAVYADAKQWVQDNLSSSSATVSGLPQALANAASALTQGLSGTSFKDDADGAAQAAADMTAPGVPVPSSFPCGTRTCISDWVCTNCGDPTSTYCAPAGEAKCCGTHAALTLATCCSDGTSGASCCGTTVLASNSQCCSDGTQGPSCCGSTALTSGNGCCSDGTQAPGCCGSTTLMTGNQCCSDGTQGPSCCGSTALTSGNGCCSDGTQAPGCCGSTTLMTGNQCCSDGTQAPNCCGSTALASGNQCCSDGTQGAGCTDATFRLVSGQSTYNGVPWFGLFLEGDCTSNCSDTRWWTGGICFPPGSTFSVLSFAVPVRQGAWAPDNTTSYTTLSGIPSDTLADFIGSNADAWFDLSVMQQPSQYPVSCDVSIHDYLTGGVTYLTISAP